MNLKNVVDFFKGSEKDRSDYCGSYGGSDCLEIMTIVAVGLVVVLLLLIFGGFLVKSGKAGLSEGQVEMNRTEVSAEDLSLDANLLSQDTAQDRSLSARNVYFAGIEDSVFYGVGKIALDNLKENGDFLMRYEVYDKDSDMKLFETGLIPSGQRVFFDPYSVLKPGTYHLMFVAIPYMEQNGEILALTNGGNEVTIVLK